MCMRLSSNMPRTKTIKPTRIVPKPNLRPATRVRSSFYSPMDQTGIPVDVVARNPESRLDPGGGRPDLGRNPVRCAFQSPIDAFCRRRRPRRRVPQSF